MAQQRQPSAVGESCHKTRQQLLGRQAMPANGPDISMEPGARPKFWSEHHKPVSLTAVRVERHFNDEGILDTSQYDNEKYSEQQQEASKASHQASIQQLQAKAQLRARETSRRLKQQQQKMAQEAQVDSPGVRLQRAKQYSSRVASTNLKDVKIATPHSKVMHSTPQHGSAGKLQGQPSSIGTYTGKQDALDGASGRQDVIKQYDQQGHYGSHTSGDDQGSIQPQIILQPAEITVTPAPQQPRSRQSTASKPTPTDTLLARYEASSPMPELHSPVIAGILSGLGDQLRIPPVALNADDTVQETQGLHGRAGQDEDILHDTNYENNHQDVQCFGEPSLAALVSDACDEQTYGHGNTLRECTSPQSDARRRMLKHCKACPAPALQQVDEVQQPCVISCDNSLNGTDNDAPCSPNQTGLLMTDFCDHHAVDQPKTMRILSQQNKGSTGNASTQHKVFTHGRPLPSTVHLHDYTNLARAREKAAKLGVLLPPLCSCGSGVSIMDPTYTDRCARNCPLWQRPDLHEQLLNQMLHTAGVI